MSRKFLVERTIDLYTNKFDPNLKMPIYEKQNKFAQFLEFNYRITTGKHLSISTSLKIMPAFFPPICLITKKKQIQSVVLLFLLLLQAIISLANVQLPFLYDNLLKYCR